jgi:hypothetical protein
LCVPEKETPTKITAAKNQRAAPTVFGPAFPPDPAAPAPATRRDPTTKVFFSNLRVICLIFYNFLDYFLKK